MNGSYKFSDSENTACFVCNHVFEKERPILFVVHDGEDGAWQFLCGSNDHNDNSVRIISLKEATEIDSSINNLYQLGLGTVAQRGSLEKEWKLLK